MENDAVGGRIDPGVLPRNGLRRVVRNNQVGARGSTDAKGIERELAVLERTVNSGADAKSDQHGHCSGGQDESQISIPGDSSRSNWLGQESNGVVDRPPLNYGPMPRTPKRSEAPRRGQWVGRLPR